MNFVLKVSLTLLLLLTSKVIFAQMDTVNTPFEKGISKDGYKEGVWEYYDKPGDLGLSINYTSGQVNFLKTDTSSYVLQIRGEWQKVSGLDSQPRYEGSMEDFKRIRRGMRYPRQAFDNRTAGSFVISFEVDTSGQAINYQVINDIGDGCSDEVISLLKLVPNRWLPAKKDGKFYAAKFLIPVTFKLTFDNKEVKPKNNKRVNEVLLGKELPAYILEGYMETKRISSH